MNWIDLKRALLYGHPPLSRDMLQPQTVKTAVREIARLVSVGWIDEPTEDMVQRIQTACAMGQCQEVWDALRSEQHPLLKIKSHNPKAKKMKKRRHA